MSDDDDDVWNTSQDGKYETPVRSSVGTPVGTPDSSNNRKIINSTIDLTERVRWLNNGVGNNNQLGPHENGQENNVEVGNDNPLLPGEQAAQEEEEFYVDMNIGGGRKKKKSRRRRKSRRKSRKSRKSKKKKKSRRKH